MRLWRFGIFLHYDDFCCCMTTLFCKGRAEKLDKRKSRYTIPNSVGFLLTAIFQLLHRLSHHAREQLKIHAHYLILPRSCMHAAAAAVHQEYQKQYNSLQQSSSFHSSIWRYYVERKEKKTQFSRCECQSRALCNCVAHTVSRLIVAHTPKDTREKSPACTLLCIHLCTLRRCTTFAASADDREDPCTEMEHSRVIMLLCADNLLLFPSNWHDAWPLG